MLQIARTLCAVLAAALAAAAGETAPANAPRVPEAGGIRLDMTLEAARQALPNAEWLDLPSVYTGKTVAIVAPNAWVLAGQPYYLKLAPHRSGAATLLIEGKVEGNDVADCRARTVALVAHLNTYFDDIKDRSVPIWQMLARPPSGQIIAHTPPGSSTPIVTGVPDVVERDEDDEHHPPSRTELSAGRNARLSETASASAKTTEGKGGFVSWGFGQPATKAYPYSLEGDASFLPADPFVSPKSRCMTRAVVRSEPWDRQREEVLDPQRKPKPLSAGALHASLDDIDLPAAPVTLAFRCDVERGSGRVGYCKAKDPAQEKLDVMRAARRRLASMEFDSNGLDPDNDVRLVTNVTIVIAPAEKLSDEVASALPLTPVVSVPKNAGPVILMQTAEPAEINRHYPAAAIAEGIEGRATATCTVKDDLTLSCTAVETIPPGAAAFDQAVRNILKHVRSGPKLTTGRPAAGTTVRIPVRFGLED